MSFGQSCRARCRALVKGMDMKPTDAELEAMAVRLEAEVNIGSGTVTPLRVRAAAMLRACKGGAVKVKPLEWVDARFRDSPRETADTLLGTYEVLQWAQGDFGGGVPKDDPDAPNSEFGGAKSMEEAKAAAQADYERRILAALEPAPDQGEWEPDILDDTSARALVGEIGNQIHNVGCEYQDNEGLSERLGEMASQCWSVAQQLSPEPTPDQAEWDAAIEAAAKVAKPKYPRPCDCEGCYCGNPGDAQAVAEWDADNFTYCAIRQLKKGQTND